MHTPELIIFDLDNTLAESKCPIDGEMTELLQKLLTEKNVGVTSGASLGQFEKQLLAPLSGDADHLKNLYLLPTDGASLYVYENDWKEIYTEALNADDKKKILGAFKQAFQETGFEMPADIHGELLDDRKSQITFSGLGSTAPLDAKKLWDPDHAKREKLVKALGKILSDFSISIAGTTSIDVTKKGIDKAYGIRHLLQYLSLDFAQAVYVGDALYEGGNDAVVTTTGIKTVSVTGPDETKKYIRGLLAS